MHKAFKPVKERLGSSKGLYLPPILAAVLDMRYLMMQIRLRCPTTDFHFLDVKRKQR